MAAIKGKDTKLELQIRKPLHHRGFRYRLHQKALPGKPDIVLPKFGAVIQVHGCFWHGHDCHLFKMPASKREKWAPKIRRNRERDREAEVQLRKAGWRIATVWECAVKGRTRLPAGGVTDLLDDWLRGEEREILIEGRRPEGAS